MVTKKPDTAKSKSEAAAPKKASSGKSVEKNTGAGAAMAAHSKDAAPKRSGKSTAGGSAKPAAAKKAPAKTAAAKASAQPSLAKRVIRKVKSAAGGVASLAGAVVGKS